CVWPPNTVCGDRTTGQLTLRCAVTVSKSPVETCRQTLTHAFTEQKRVEVFPLKINGGRYSVTPRAFGWIRNGLKAYANGQTGGVRRLCRKDTPTHSKDSQSDRCSA